MHPDMVFSHFGAQDLCIISYLRQDEDCSRQDKEEWEDSVPGLHSCWTGLLCARTGLLPIAEIENDH